MSGLPCGAGAGGVPAPMGPGSGFAAQGVLVGKDANYDGVIEPNEMGFMQTGGAVVGGGGMACGTGAAGGYSSGMMPGAMMSGGYGGGAVGIPTRPGGAFAASGTLVGKDFNHDGVIEPNEMAFVPGGGMPAPGPFPDDGDCNDCVRTVTTYKTVQVPCTRNRYKVVNYTVPKTVPYTDYQTVTKSRCVTRQVPKTIMVPVKTTEPYQTQVPVTKYKTINIPQSRTTCDPYTTIVTRRIPVVNVVPKPPAPCPPQPCGDSPYVNPVPNPMPPIAY